MEQGNNKNKKAELEAINQQLAEHIRLQKEAIKNDQAQVDKALELFKVLREIKNDQKGGYGHLTDDLQEQLSLTQKILEENAANEKKVQQLAKLQEYVNSGLKVSATLIEDIVSSKADEVDAQIRIEEQLKRLEKIDENRKKLAQERAIEVQKEVEGLEEYQSVLDDIGATIGTNSKLYEAQKVILDAQKTSLQSISAVIANMPTEELQNQGLAAAEAYKQMYTEVAKVRKKMKAGEVGQKEYNETVEKAYKNFETVADKIDTSTEAGKNLKTMIMGMGAEMHSFSQQAQQSSKHIEGLEDAFQQMGSSGVPVLDKLIDLVGNVLTGKTNLLKAGLIAVAAAAAKMALDYAMIPYQVALDRYYDRLQNVIDLKKQLKEIEIDYQPEFLQEEFDKKAGIKAKEVEAQSYDLRVENENKILNIRKDLQQEVLAQRIEGDKRIREAEIEASFAGARAAQQWNAQVQQAAAQFKATAATALFGNRLGSVSYSTAKMQLMGIGADKVAEAMSAASKTLGKMPTSRMGSDFAVMAARTGQSVEGIAQMNDFFQRMDKVTASVALNLTEGMAGLAKKAGISLGNLMEEVASASKDALGYQIKSGKALAKQVAYAQSIGISFNDVAKAGKSMVLNYQESIKAEMELSALLGEQVDLSEVRQLFAEGDTKGAIEAIKAQGLDPKEMNMFQQDALAKTLGMDLASLEKIFSRTGVDADLEEGNAKGANASFLNRGTGAQAGLVATQAQISAQQAVFDAKLQKKIGEALLGGYLDDKETNVAMALDKAAMDLVKAGKANTMEEAMKKIMAGGDALITMVKDSSVKFDARQKSIAEIITKQQNAAAVMLAKTAGISFEEAMTRVKSDPNILGKKEFVGDKGEKIQGIDAFLKSKGVAAEELKTVNELINRAGMVTYKNIGELQTGQKISVQEMESLKNKMQTQNGIVFLNQQKLKQELENQLQLNELEKKNIQDKAYSINPLTGEVIASNGTMIRMQAEQQKATLEANKKDAKLNSQELEALEIQKKQLEKKKGWMDGLLGWVSTAVVGTLGAAGMIRASAATVGEGKGILESLKGSTMKEFFVNLIGGKSFGTKIPATTTTTGGPTGGTTSSGGQWNTTQTGSSKPPDVGNKPKIKPKTNWKKTGGKAAVILGAATVLEGLFDISGKIKGLFGSDKKEEQAPPPPTPTNPIVIPPPAPQPGSLSSIDPSKTTLDPKSQAGATEQGLLAASSANNIHVDINKKSDLRNSPQLRVFVVNASELNEDVAAQIQEGMASTYDINKSVSDATVEAMKSQTGHIAMHTAGHYAMHLALHKAQHKWEEWSAKRAEKRAAQQLAKTAAQETGESVAQQTVKKGIGSKIISAGKFVATKTLGEKTAGKLAAKVVLGKAAAKTLAVNFTKSLAGKAMTGAFGGPLSLLTTAVGGVADVYGDIKKQEALMTGDKGAAAVGKASSTAGTAIAAAGWGAMIGSVIPGIGTAVGAAVGLVVGTLKGLWDNYFSADAERFDREVELQGVLNGVQSQMYLTMQESMKKDAVYASLSADEPTWRQAMLEQTVEITRLIDAIAFDILPAMYNKNLNDDDILNKVGRKDYDIASMVGAKKGFARDMTDREKDIYSKINQAGGSSSIQTDEQGNVVGGQVTVKGKQMSLEQYMKDYKVTMKEINEAYKAGTYQEIAAGARASQPAPAPGTPGTPTPTPTVVPTAGGGTTTTTTTPTTATTGAPAPTTTDSILTLIQQQADARGMIIASKLDAVLSSIQAQGNEGILKVESAVNKLYGKMVEVNGNLQKQVVRTDKIVNFTSTSATQLTALNATVTQLKAVNEGIQKLLDVTTTGKGGTLQLMIDGKQVTRVIEARADNNKGGGEITGDGNS